MSDVEGLLKALEQIEQKAISAMKALTEDQRPFAQASDICEIAQNALANHIKSDGWRPISEAPKDRKILLWALTDSSGNYQTEVCYWNEINKCWFWWNGSTNPTHWQPLPSPPADNKEIK